MVHAGETTLWLLPVEAFGPFKPKTGLTVRLLTLRPRPEVTVTGRKATTLFEAVGNVSQQQALIRLIALVGTSLFDLFLLNFLDGN